MMKKVWLVLAVAAVAALPAMAAQRTVAMEEMSATSWGYCPNADNALGQLVDEQGLDKIAPVVWLNGASPQAPGRFSFYGVSSTPQIWCDASYVGSYGYDAQLNAYNSRRTVSSPVTIQFLSKSYSSTTACVKVKVTLTETLAEGNVVYIILWEDKVPLAHTWRFMERSMDGYQVLTVTQSGQSQIFTKTFTLEGSWTKANLGCSVYAQKFSDKTMYNAAATKLVAGDAVAPASLGRVKVLFN
jgi:hypothetical protein